MPELSFLVDLCEYFDNVLGAANDRNFVVLNKPNSDLTQ